MDIWDEPEEKGLATLNIFIEKHMWYEYAIVLWHIGRTGATVFLNKSQFAPKKGDSKKEAELKRFGFYKVLDRLMDLRKTLGGKFKIHVDHSKYL